jgi:hypothetical protein
LQVHSCTTAPSAVLPPDTSTHLPSALRVEPERAQVWAAFPLQLTIWSGLPSAASAHGTSMHMPLAARTGPVPAGRVEPPPPPPSPPPPSDPAMGVAAPWNGSSWM